MAAEYFLGSGNQKLGPFTERQILGGIRSGKISLFDNIFNKQLGTWVMLMQHPDFCDMDTSAEGEPVEAEGTDSPLIGLSSEEFSEKTEVPMEIRNEVVPDLERPYWYEKTRPSKAFKFLDVVSLLHQRVFSEHTLIAKSAKGPWKPLIEWEDFSKESLAEFQQNTREEIPDVMIRRKYPRFDCGKTFIVVANGKGFKAFCPDISKSGMSFIVRVPKATMTESLFVKFNDVLDNTTFDAKAVVVGVRKIRVSDTGEVYIRYALRFTHLSEQGKRAVSALTSSVAQS